jgi:hypothetical protein
VHLVVPHKGNCILQVKLSGKFVLAGDKLLIALYICAVAFFWKVSVE